MFNHRHNVVDPGLHPLFKSRAQREMQKRKGHPATGRPLLQGRI